MDMERVVIAIVWARSREKQEKGTKKWIRTRRTIELFFFKTNGFCPTAEIPHKRNDPLATFRQSKPRKTTTLGSNVVLKTTPEGFTVDFHVLWCPGRAPPEFTGCRGSGPLGTKEISISFINVDFHDEFFNIGRSGCL